MSADPELVHRVRFIVSAMEPQVREVFLLSCVSELRNDEIAEWLGIGIEAVEDRLVQAIVALAAGLPSEGNDNERG
jgi:DNA-directed RNA polymerase specialized sigma24 family protein